MCSRFPPSTPKQARILDDSVLRRAFLRPGEYKAAFTVRDQNSDKTGTFEVPFTVALPTAN